MGISAYTQTAIIDCYFLSLHRQVMEKAIEIRSKCKHFRVLIIGRSNAGKTTILKKVCNSIDEPMILSPSGEKVRGILSCVRLIFKNRITCRLMHRSSTLLTRSESMTTSTEMFLILLTVYIYSVESTISTTNWFLKAIQISYSTTLADSKQALSTSWSWWKNLSEIERIQMSYLTSCMPSGTVTKLLSLWIRPFTCH